MEKSKKSLNKGLITSFVMSAFLIILSVWGNMIHEPWFDESQAWVLAKNASWSDILFYFPHYEGHPPLWHIILKLVSCTGLSFVTAMNAVQVIMYSAAVILLEFKSPFKPILKITLPLGYFFLYQYSVISRPYSLLTAAVFLCAVCFRKRREKPFAYMLALLLMCLCHSYGIAFAGGLVIADIISDSADEKSFFKACKKIIADKKRFASYVILLLSALCIVAEIMPAKNAIANINSDDGLVLYIKKLLFSWFQIPSENLITSDSVYVLFRDQGYSFVNVFTEAVISVIIWSILYFISRKRGKALFVFMPYLCVSFLIAKYSMPHHFGIFYILLIFVLWICDEAEPLSLDNIRLKGDNQKLVRKLAAVGLFIPVMLNVYWSFYSLNADRKYSYDSTGELAGWIAENNYQDGYVWMADFEENNTNMISGSAVTLSAYLDKNLFCNMDRNLPYSTHILPDEDEIRADIEEMKEMGSPDFILAKRADVDVIIDKLDLSDEYQAVYISCGDNVFKDVDTVKLVMVYAKKGLVKHKELNMGLE